MSELYSVNIDGVGNVVEGEYDKIVINGVGKYHGEIKCNELSVNGTSRGEANINGKKITINGASNNKGIINFSEKLEINGTFKFNNGQGNKLHVAGVLRVNESLIVKEANIEGVCKVKGNFEADEIHVDGSVKVEGLLTADKIEIKTRQKCEIEKIGGGVINITGNNNGSEIKIFGINLKGKKRVHTQEIEGDEITLTDTNAIMVRGNNITIGERCNIETVEYTGTIKIDPRSKIGKINKV